MLTLNPPLVRFGAEEWTDVTAVAIDRLTTRPALDWSDLGPHPTFADSPEQRTEVKIVRALRRAEPAMPRPGQAGAVTFWLAPGPAAGPAQVAFTGVVVDVRHELGPRGALRTVHLVALSPDGATDPITITPGGAP